MAKNKLLSDTTILTLNNSISIVVSIIQAKILASCFSLADVGLQTQVNITSTLLMSFFVMGLPSTPQFFIPRADSPLEKKNFVSQLYFLYNIIGFLSAVAVTFLMPFIVSYFKNPALEQCSLILILQPWVKLFASAYNGIMVSQGKAKQTAYFGFVRAAISILTLGCVWLIELSIVQYLYINFFVEAVFAVLMFIVSIRSVHGIKFFYFDKKLLKEILFFALPLGVSGIVGTLTVETDKLFVSYFYDTEQLAVYNNVAKELPLTLLSSSFLSVLLPLIVRYVKHNKIDKAFRLWKLVIEFSAYIMVFGVMALIVFSREIILILYSEKYLSGQPVFIIFAIVLIARITYFGMMLKARGEARSILYCSVATLVLNVILNLVFQYFFGIVGFALGTLVSIVAVNILQLILTSRHMKIPFSDVFPWKQLGRILLLNIAFAAVFAAVKYMLHIEERAGDIIFSVLLGCVWLAIYFLVIKNKIKSITTEMSALQNEAELED